MNLNYEKIKNRFEHQSGHQWTSYSDLFLVLSVTFLLLYVFANLKSGTSSLAQAQALHEARQEVEDLKRQIRAYDSFKDEYLQKGASSEEIAGYQQLMDKLSLLEDQARDDDENFSRKAQEARERKQGLNRYQALIKNVLNANLISSAKLKNRDFIIAAQGREVENLDREVKTREEEINRNNAQILEIQTQLEQKTVFLQHEAEVNAKRRVKYKEELKKLEEESGQKIASLRQANNQYESELTDTKSKLDEKNREAEQLMTSLAKREADYKADIEELTKGHDAALAQQKGQYEASLRAASLSAEAKLAKEREHQAEMEKRDREYSDRMAKLNSDLQGTRQELTQAKSKYQGSIQALAKTNEALQRNLNASIDKLNQQKKLAEQIREGFAKAGINAQVDGKTGDVTIQFAHEYFDTDQASLKPGMKNILEKTMPIYAKSLFQDPKIAGKIGSVEIVGFASPTFQGKLVDPGSLSSEDRLAVNYNMDLSYRRAKSIFEYTFNPERIQFQYQKTLLPLVKVSGRSYLSAERIGDGRAPASREEYCQKYDCKKNQIVIIKFNLKEE